MNPPGDLTTFVRDVTDRRQPTNVCSVQVPDPGPIRFVTATIVSVLGHNSLYELDTQTGKEKVLTSWPDPSGIIEYDTTADGAEAAYALFDGKDTISFHLVQNGADKTLSTFPGYGCCGTARVEFSPSGKYLALGATG